MGLTIHYKGSIKDKTLLPDLIDEIRGICEGMNFKYHVYEKEFPAKLTDPKKHDSKLYGISFSPKDCEPVSFSFLSNGRMCGPANLFAFGDLSKPEYQDYLYSVFTKTQYAGLEAHVFIIKIFRHISEKYLSNFSMNDEGGYWETDDIEVLKKQFARYNFIVDSFADALENIPPMKDEELEAFLLRIAEMIQKGDKDEDSKV